MHIFAKFVSDLIFLQNRDKLNIKKFCMSELPSTGHIKEGPTRRHAATGTHARRGRTPARPAARPPARRADPAALASYPR
jgi:hypothetical protein